VPVGVLVPWSGSNSIDATLAWTRTPSRSGHCTVRIAVAPPLQTAGPGALHAHCAAAPVCTTQQVASARLKKLTRTGTLRSIASVRTACRSVASWLAMPPTRRTSITP